MYEAFIACYMYDCLMLYLYFLRTSSTGSDQDPIDATGEQKGKNQQQKQQHSKSKCVISITSQVKSSCLYLHLCTHNIYMTVQNSE